MGSVSMGAVGMAGMSVGRSTSSSADVNTVNDTFKKLLQNKQDEAAGTDTKTNAAAGDEAPEKTEAEEADGAEDTESSGGASEAEDAEAAGMQEELAAAYQMSQSMRPEITAAAAETGQTAAEAAVETAAELVPGTAEGEGLTAEAAQTQAAGAAAEAEGASAGETAQAEAEGAEQQADSQAQQAAASYGNAATADVISTEAPQAKAAVTVHVPQPEQLPEQVGSQIAAQMAGGVQELEIQIEPANLGKISVNIQYSEGQATISLVCSEKSTMELLGSNAKEISALIERNLGGTTTIIVEEAQESDYLNRESEDARKDGQEEQGQEKDGKGRDTEDSGEFLQKLRLGLLG